MNLPDFNEFGLTLKWDGDFVKEQIDDYEKQFGPLDKDGIITVAYTAAVRQSRNDLCRYHEWLREQLRAQIW